MKILSLVVLLFGAATAFAQDDPVFDKGVIVTKRGDSLRCFLRVEAEYGSRIFYKKEMAGREISIRKKDVNFIAGSHEFLQNIQVGKKELLMTLAANGRVGLFFHVTTGASRRQSILGVPTQAKPIPHIVFVIKMGSIYTEVKRERYREILSALLHDCPAVAQKMRDKERAYAYEHMDQAVADYNACR
jgi:hypothetical protein